MSNYKVAQILKCYLQMQTPIDSSHWQGDELDTTKELAAVCAIKQIATM